MEAEPSDRETGGLHIKLAEYQAAQATYLHYDAFRWQAGSFLIAGVFIFWGLLVQRSTDPDVVASGSVLVTGLMSIWLLFAHHYRQIYLAKLNRIHEIETELGMEQHRRFVAQDGLGSRYRTYGPSGHHLDIGVYPHRFRHPASCNRPKWILLAVLGLAPHCAREGCDGGHE